MTATVLVLTVGMMGTMAYLSTVTNPKQNTFTGSKGIELTLKEPNWNPQDPATPKPGDGQYDAENYTPGKVIAKDPTLQNTTKATGDSNAQEWVAMAVTYQINDTDVSYTTLKNLISDITFNTSDDPVGKWVLLEPLSSTVLDEGKGYSIFIYNKPLRSSSEIGGTDGQGDSTRALFDSITIKDTTNLTTGLTTLNSALNPSPTFTINGGLPTFKINVIGAAVKNEYDKWDGSQYVDNTLASNLDELKAEDKTALQTNLLSVLKNELASDGTLGFVTKQ